MRWQKLLAIGYGCLFVVAAQAGVDPASSGTIETVPGHPHLTRTGQYTATPAEMAVLKEMARLDAQPDRLARCLHYPNPPGVAWDSREIKALCHIQFDPLLTLAQLRQTFDTQGPEALDRYFEGLHKAQAQVETSWKLDEAFLRTFSCGCKEARDLADAWLARSPESVWAHVASGLYYVSAGGTARGSASIGETSAARIQRMEVLDKRGADALQRALTASPGLTPATYGMLWIEARAGSTTEANERVAAALREHPYNLMLHENAALLYQSRWGGSDEAQDAEKRLAMKASAENPALLLVVGQVETQKRSCNRDCTLSDADAEVIDPMGPSLPVLRQLAKAHLHGGDFSGATILASELLRFSPSSEIATHTWRGMARVMMHDIDGAAADGEAALIVDPGYEPALELMQSLRGD
ncbi:MAG: DUF4034 domain-containing protein [Luteibacter sp.]